MSLDRFSRESDTADRERVVCHVDVDCFYAACERLREPELRDEPVVVGMGFEPGETHGAVATASYEAREHGVESAQAISEALERLPRKADNPESTDAPGDAEGEAAPDANGEAADDADTEGTEDDDTAADTDDVDTEAADDESAPEASAYYRPVDMAFYEDVAEDVRAILQDEADVVRAVSIDEAYLDVTDRVGWSPPGETETFARRLKNRIDAEVGVTASVGVAPNMATAKVASDHEKPDGLVVVEPGRVRDFLGPLDVRELHGVGPVTASELRDSGIETAGDLAEADPGEIESRFGERGRELYDRARGHDDRDVEPVGKPKSLSRESAFAEETADTEEKRERVRALAADVADRARRKDALYKTIGIKVVTPPFEINTRAHSLPGPVDDPGLVEEVALNLLGEFEEESVRKLGVRVANLSFTEGDQASLDSWDGRLEGGGSSGGADGESTRDGDWRPYGQTTFCDFD